MVQYKGASRQHEVKASKRRKDTRRFGQRFSDFYKSGDGAILGTILLPIFALIAIQIPFSGELILLLAWIFKSTFVDTDNRAFDFPYRVPRGAKVRDGSTEKGASLGSGVTLIGNDNETKEQIYAGDSDLRTHMLVLGTTGSGKPQPYTSLVLTLRGWVQMGSLKVGDIVCTPDGKAAPIVRLFEQGVCDVWKLTTKRNRQACATGDHLWRVLISRKNAMEEARTISTDEIRELLAEGVKVKLPRVKRRANGTAKFQEWVQITKVEFIGKEQCRCIEIDHPDHLYVTNNNLVTHNTEFLLGLVFNALVQNTGCIYVDGKGDPKLQKEIFRLARYLGREDDLLIINFITSGRDFIEKQTDKVTNNMNIMGNTSSGMLIELIVSLMDDSGGGGDMWKGRAISYVAALTRPLTYLRDKGYINLSPEKYLEYFELNVIEELVWEHNGRYGELFDVIVAPLRSYLITLPGYQKTKIKKQETKTLEQHGFIVMQLTRIFNDLTFTYGHIFKTKVGDVDFYDVVINRRILVVLLPALERAPDSLRMLGKMIVGSIKQMMAGCLGNRVEGVVREIIDSRPTNADFPFYVICDEYGYYAVVGFAVAPAQARSLGFSIIFAAQDFSSLKKSSAEEADATWENTNVRAVGRITSGQKSETWERIQGASGEADEARLTGYERKMGAINEHFRQQDNVSIDRRARLDYDDLAMQEKGEFTFLIGKKENSGQTGGVRVIRGMGFYTASKAPKEMRINDLLPIESPEPSDLPQNKLAVDKLLKSFMDGSFNKSVRSVIKIDPVLSGMAAALNKNHDDPERPRLSRIDAGFAALGWYLTGGGQIPATKPIKSSSGGSTATSPVDSKDLRPEFVEPPKTTLVSAPVTAAPEKLDLHQAGAHKALLNVAEMVLSEPKAQESYNSATPVGLATDDDEITISTNVVTTNIMLTNSDSTAFRERALPILRQHLYMLGDVSDDELDDNFDVATKEKLLEMEVVAANKGFSSLRDKWATEDRIVETQTVIAETTSYIPPPEPEKMHVREAKDMLSDLTDACKELMRETLRDN